MSFIKIKWDFLYTVPKFSIVDNQVVSVRHIRPGSAKVKARLHAQGRAQSLIRRIQDTRMRTKILVRMPF